MVVHLTKCLPCIYSSSAQRSCPSWPSHTYQPSSRIEPPLLRNEPTDYTEQPRSWFPTSLSACHSSVRDTHPTGIIDIADHYTVLISFLFSIVSYWLSNFRPSGDAFFTWVMWIFLDLVAAESLVVFMTAIFPNFVIALALVAFANGLWMSVGGFLMPATILNPFWKYVFHYIDYQVRQEPFFFFPFGSLFCWSCVILTSSTGICLPGNDGQRILEAKLLVRRFLPVSVPDRSRAGVYDPRHGSTGAVRLRDW